MPISWVQPVFIYSVIYNLASYALLSLILFFIYKKKIINRRYYFLYLIFLLSPFFFNGFLFHWSEFPDQSKYLDMSYNIRHNPEILFLSSTYNFIDTKILLSSIIYAFSPIISMETYIGISLYNRFLFLLTLIFLVNRKLLENYELLFFLLAPSLILYSSLALRDNLIIILLFFFVYFFYHKKYLFLFFTIIFLFFFRFPILSTILIFFIATIVIEDNKINYKGLFLIILTLIIFFGIFKDEIMFFLNFFRSGFFSEEYGQYLSITNNLEYREFKLELNIKSLLMAVIGYFNFLLPPIFKGKVSFFYLIQMIEVVFILIFFYLKIKLQNNLNLFILLKWLVIYMLSYFTYSLIIFNDATIHRYKVPILFFVILGYLVNVRTKKI